MIHPFVRLMRKYAIDYTNSHDLSVCDSIMHPGYRVHVSNRVLDRDSSYKSAVDALFHDFPGLQMDVHEILTNGEMLAMRFTEHGASLRRGGRGAAWSGIGLYTWDGCRLTSNYVEQDFFARRLQLAAGRPAPIEPPHVDPWLGATVGEPCIENEETLRSWLEAGDLRPPTAIVDGSWYEDCWPPPLHVETTDLTRLFSAGNKVAFHAIQTGSYCGGLFDADARFIGRACSLRIIGIATFEDRRLNAVRIITDRDGTRSQLKAS